MFNPLRHLDSRWIALLTVCVMAAAAAVGALVASYDSPEEGQASRQAAPVAGAEEHEHHADHTGRHHGHVDEFSIKLSRAALKNIGYVPYTVGLGDYERTISLPGMVVERPGKTQIRVSAPLGGSITRSYVMQGEAIAPSSPLFDIRLTHEELASAQGEFLETVEALDVINAEIKRLEGITEGVIAVRRIVEQKYERQKLEARLRSQRQGLLLHGLSAAQVDEILATRELLKSLTVYAPTPEEHGDHPLHIQSLNVQMGEQVAAGDTLCVLADHCELYIQGTAFEADTPHLRNALETGDPLSADILASTRREQAVSGLKLLYLADRIDQESRALHFYVRLPNEIVADRRDNSHRFIQWRFNPGQRVELRLPVERWENRLVLPADAVVTDGAESYVYRQSGESFQRVPVHVEHRGPDTAVIANDGSVFPGEVVANKAAFQIHLALKNKSGAAPDPHAGHGH